MVTLLRLTHGLLAGLLLVALLPVSLRQRSRQHRDWIVRENELVDEWTGGSAGGTRCFTDATLVIGSPGLIPCDGPVLAPPRPAIERAFSRHVGPRIRCLYLRTRAGEPGASGQGSDSFFPLYIGLAGDGEVMALARLIQAHTQWPVVSVLGRAS
jgi:hypothetical protein